jgi:pimeloyl-ACP methyl ester carboxylesterase
LNRRTALTLIAAAPLAAKAAPPSARWLTLPPTPQLPKPNRAGYTRVNGIDLWSAEFGARGPAPPLILLHGGLANANYWGGQVAAFRARRHVIAIDSRGHGRSGRNDRPFGYDLMTDDVVAMMDARQIPKAVIIGWSDGAIFGLDMAMRHPQRVAGVFSFAANADPSGVKEDTLKNPTFARFVARARLEYQRLSRTPHEYDAFLAAISHMWDTQPNWTAADLRRITAPVVIADGDHDEAIKREHTEMLAREIPNAQLLILPGVSHFAFLQDPKLFDAALTDFLSEA